MRGVILINTPDLLFIAFTLTFSILRLQAYSLLSFFRLTPFIRLITNGDSLDPIAEVA